MLYHRQKGNFGSYTIAEFVGVLVRKADMSGRIVVILSVSLTHEADAKNMLHISTQSVSVLVFIWVSR